MPSEMARMFLAMLVLAVDVRNAFKGGSGSVEGARFGALVGVFSVLRICSAQLCHLNIGLKLTSTISGLFVEWVVTCIVIGPNYRPAH